MLVAVSAERVCVGVCCGRVTGGHGSRACRYMKQNRYALQFASVGLHTDEDVVLVAVKQNGYALRFAADGLQADNGTVLVAVKQNGYALGYAANG